MLLSSSRTPSALRAAAHDPRLSLPSTPPYAQAHGKTPGLEQLWNHRPPEEKFIQRFHTAAFAILEQPGAHKVGATSLRDALWRLVALPALRYKQTDAVVSRLVEFVSESTQEAMIKHVAELMKHLLDEFSDEGANRLVTSVLEELAALPDSQLADDKASSKNAQNVASFLTALAGHAPLLLSRNMELLQPLLDAHAYQLRAGCVRAHGQLLVQLARLRMCSASHAEAEEMRTQTPPAELLQVLLDRTTDTIASVRGAALDSLCSLCDFKVAQSTALAVLCATSVLPLEKYLEVAEKALERLLDKGSADVRKKALQLFGKLLDSNPYLCRSFNVTQLQAQRNELREQVAIAASARDKSDAAETDKAVTAEKAGEVASVAASEDAVGEAAAGHEAVDENEDAASDIKQPPSTHQPAQTREERTLEVLEHAMRFEELMRQRLLSNVLPLLHSGTASDVEWAIEAVVFAQGYSLQGARAASVLPLVFSKKEVVKKAALRAAQDVFLDCTSARGRGGTVEQVQTACRKLLDLAREASFGELTSLEEVMSEWHEEGLLPPTLIATLWEVVRGPRAQAADRSPALALLNMAGAKDAQLLRCERALLIEQTKAQAQALENGLAKLDLTFTRHLCIALRRSASAGSLEPKQAKAITGAMERLLTNAPPPAQAGAWYAVADHAIANLFAFGLKPDKMCTDVLHKMGERLSAGAPTPCPGALSRLLFGLGHVAIKMLVHLEDCEKKLRQGEQATAADAETKKVEAGKEKHDADDAAEDKKKASEAAADEERQLFESFGEQLLDPTALVGAWAPLVIAVCRNEGGHFGVELRGNAVLALCKFMCLSPSFCEAQLPLLFETMQNEPEGAIRANIAVALGDLAGQHRTTNVVEPWMPHFYAQLSHRTQPDTRVRKTVLTVLTHLILGGTIRPKGAVELALRLVDEDAHLASLARLFFGEYKTMDTTNVYKMLPDVVSALSTDANLSPEAFREVIGFLFTFIPKEGKYIEQMADTLCHRFSGDDAPRFHRCIAFCVCELPHTAKSLSKVLELKNTWRNKLGDDEALDCFKGLVARMRKSLTAQAKEQPELKPAVDKLEQSLKPGRKGGDDEAGDSDAENEPPTRHGSSRSEVTREALSDAPAQPGQPAVAATGGRKGGSRKVAAAAPAAVPVPTASRSRRTRA